MAIKTVNHVFSKDNGKTNEIICPLCSKPVSMRLFENVDVSVITYLLGKETKTDFAVCPKCAGVFNVAENYLKEYKNGTVCYLTEDDLTVIKKSEKSE